MFIIDYAYHLIDYVLQKTGDHNSQKELNPLGIVCKTPKYLGTPFINFTSITLVRD